MSSDTQKGRGHTDQEKCETTVKHELVRPKVMSVTTLSHNHTHLERWGLLAKQFPNERETIK